MLRWFNGSIFILEFFVKMYTLLNIFLSFWVKGVDDRGLLIFYSEFSNFCFHHLEFSNLLLVDFLSFLLWESASSFYLPIYSHYITLIYSQFALALEAKEPTLKSFHSSHPHSITLSILSRRTVLLITYHNLFIYLSILSRSLSYFISHTYTERIQYSQRLKKFLLPRIECSNFI